MGYARTIALLIMTLATIAMTSGCAPGPRGLQRQAESTGRYDDIPGVKAVQGAQKRNRTLVVRPSLDDVRFTDDGVRVLVQQDTQWTAFDLTSGLNVPLQDGDVPLEETPEPETPTGDSSARDAQGPPSTVDAVATATDAPPKDNAKAKPKRKRVPRGGQATQVTSPDEQWTAECIDFNVVLHGPNGRRRTVTSRGTEAHRFGAASWVYGEELDQNSAMWFSPDSQLLAFYEFNVTDVPDYHLLDGLTDLRPTVQGSSYPKPGDANPVPGLWIYSIKHRRMTRVDVGDSLGTGGDQYIYGIRFTPDSRYLLYHRMNRLQNKVELVRVNPKSGKSTVLFSESQSTWVDFAPDMRWLDDGKRFLIASERSDFRTWELWHVDTGQLAVLGPADFPSQSVIRVDECESMPGGGTLYFTGYSDTHPLNLQLHGVQLDGTDFRRLTNASLNHSNFRLSPNGKNVIATATNALTPHRIMLYGEQGQALATIAQSDTSALEQSTSRPSELFQFEADDGQIVFGRVHYPSNFDASDTWPVLVQVYGGPSTRAIRNTFQLSNPRAEFGFVIVQIDNRGTGGRGKAFEGSTYLKLGQIDLDDQAKGVRVLAERHNWLDTNRVGITGHSYGGYMSALAMLRYPEVFSVAAALAPVTDWRNYDTIYAERYMRTPAVNGDNYDAGSCVELAEHLKGQLLLVHGMVDDNVHPTNTWQLAEALQAADIPFEMHMYPNSTHSLRSKSIGSVKWSFLTKHLIR